MLTVQKDDILKRKYECIISIKGLGKVATISLLHLFIKYPNANAKQIISLSGLDPIIKESGTSIRGKSRISKQGTRIYRASLFMAAMVAIRHNDKMRVFYERLKDNGKHTTVAQVAVMRKLIVVAFSLYNNDALYDEDRYISDCGLVDKDSSSNNKESNNNKEAVVNAITDNIIENNNNSNEVLKIKEESKQNIRRFEIKDKDKKVEMIS